MDYLFIVRFFGQQVDAALTIEAIRAAANNSDVGLQYCEVVHNRADPENPIPIGILGIARAQNNDDYRLFFDSVRLRVAAFNELEGDLGDGMLPRASKITSASPAEPSKWARQSVEAVVQGFDVVAPPELDSDMNEYRIATILRGGIGGMGGGGGIP